MNLYHALSKRPSARFDGTTQDLDASAGRGERQHPPRQQPQRPQSPLPTSQPQALRPQQTRSSLTLNVIRAAGLKKADLFGKSDPYVIVLCGKIEVGRTKIIPSTLDPEWNHSFSLPDDLLHRGVSLEVSVWAAVVDGNVC